MFDLVECFPRRLAGFFQVKAGLQSHPEVFRGARCPCQPDCRVSSNRVPAVHDVIDSAWRHAKCADRWLLIVYPDAVSALAPPGAGSLTMVVNSCASHTVRSCYGREAQREVAFANETV